MDNQKPVKPTIFVGGGGGDMNRSLSELALQELFSKVEKAVEADEIPIDEVSIFTAESFSGGDPSFPFTNQYKFFVDGEWRHDEHQPFVTGSYGVVNFLSREPEVIPAIYILETPGRSHMEVDNVLPLGIPVAPLWDFCKSQFVGVLSALDFILVLRELGSHRSNLTEEELETHTILAWKEGKLHLNRQKIDSCCRTYPRRLVHAGPYDSLKDVALKILQNKVAIVPVIHSSSQDGSFPQLLHLASLSGILKYILDILLALCQFFNNQFVLFLLVQGFRKLGNQMGIQLQC